MKTLLFSSVSLVWFGLVAATGLSWWMGTGHVAGFNQAYLTTMVIVVALIKTRFVMRYFMEVKDADRPLRWLTDAWVAIVLVAIIGLYAYGG